MIDDGCLSGMHWSVATLATCSQIYIYALSRMYRMHLIYYSVRPPHVILSNPNTSLACLPLGSDLYAYLVVFQCFCHSYRTANLVWNSTYEVVAGLAGATQDVRCEHDALPLFNMTTILS